MLYLNDYLNMKQGLLFTFLFILISTLTLSAQGIEFFHGSWEDAIEIATKQEKIIFVDAYTTWCGPCKRMSANVFTREEAGSFYNENFINVKIDMEKPDGRNFGSKYPVSAYPTLFFLDPKGKMLKKVVGGQQLEGLLSLGNTIISEFDFSAKYREAYEDGDRSFENTINYIEALNKSGKSSLKIANEYIRDASGLSEAQKTAFYFKAVSESDSGLFEEMIDRKSEVIKTFGKEAFEEKVRMAANRTVDKAIEFENERLLKSAIKSVKKHGGDAAKEFAIDANMNWAFAQKDVKAALKSAKKKKAYMLETKDKINWTKDAQQVFPKETSVLEFSYDLLKKDLSSSEDADHITIFTKLLLQLEKKQEALTFITAAQERVKDARTKNYLKNMIRYVENYKL